jgi:hypothetical protein
MDNTQQFLEDTFQNHYSEYKDYETYIKSKTKKLEKDRNEFAKFALANQSDMDKVLTHMFEVNEKPALQANDLMKLQTRLVNTYETLKEIIDLPKEVREEINAIPKPKLSYKIEDGKDVEINKQANDEIRKYVRENSLDFIKNNIFKN